MSTIKEFRAKTVDQAIEAACRFFAVDRDSLEIDIVSGGSSGIFGLGAKKATIRAKKRHVMANIEPSTLDESRSPKDLKKGQVSDSFNAHKAEDLAEDSTLDEEDDLQETVLLSPKDQESLNNEIQQILTALLLPVSPAPRLTVNTSRAPITVHIDDDANSGLIIGRDGQTIAALQYLANRIISKSWPGSPHIQLDAGDYRQKQQEQLEDLALSLSEKARKSGKVQSTRPLSPFHRRLVHMALQNDRSVQTRSKGEGPMKRVLILPAKRGKSARHSPKDQESLS